MACETLVIIPCLNEEEALPLVLNGLPWGSEDLRVVVVDNGSTDRSAGVARENGAEVVVESRRGYGSACLRGLEELGDEPFVAFIDADYSDYPEELTSLLQPLKDDRADFVLGTRMQLPESRRALLPQARFGNRLAAVLLRLFYRHRCTDLGPFRTIKSSALRQLEMKDRGFGWTVEMQAKAGLHGLRTLELPVRYRSRVGSSKITGTVTGTLAASWKILYTLFTLRLRLWLGRRA